MPYWALPSAAIWACDCSWWNEAVAEAGTECTTDEVVSGLL
jgi:hypothetical protein